jgi:NADPH:quinone reductase-like Zn-dependent oxidoreductase
MKAVYCTRYGPPEVLQLQEVPVPAPKDNEVLIKVRATSVTASDTIIRGFKLPNWSFIGIMMRLAIGFRKPRNPILGMVLAGEVVATGNEVTRFKKGDAVYGSTFTPRRIRFGAYAGHVCLPESSLIAPKPANLSYEEAAAIPYGAGLAWHYLKQAELQPGQKVLVYGASGAIGTAAVQLAVAQRAEVTGVCSGPNLELVKSLGAEKVIDYTRPDAVSQLEKYDLVLDAVGKAKRSELKDKARYALKPGGKMLSVDDGTPSHTHEDVALFSELVEAGKLKPVIDRCYPLAEMVEAHRYVDTGRKKGNVVIIVTGEGESA